MIGSLRNITLGKLVIRGSETDRVLFRACHRIVPSAGAKAIDAKGDRPHCDRRAISHHHRVQQPIEHQKSEDGDIHLLRSNLV